MAGGQKPQKPQHGQRQRHTNIPEAEAAAVHPGHPCLLSAWITWPCLAASDTGSTLLVAVCCAIDALAKSVKEGNARHQQIQSRDYSSLSATGIPYSFLKSPCLRTSVLSPQPHTPVQPSTQFSKYQRPFLNRLHHPGASTLASWRSPPRSSYLSLEVPPVRRSKTFLQVTSVTAAGYLKYHQRLHQPHRESQLCGGKTFN